MRSQRIRSVKDYLEAESASWNSIGFRSIALVPTPIGLQPKPYIGASWQGRPYGAVSHVAVACVHDGSRIAFRLRWHSAAQTLAEGEHFPDGAAIALPVRGEPPLVLMGTSDAPIHILQWQAGIAEPRPVLASGIGSSRPGPSAQAVANARWADGAWTVVIARALGSGENVAPLEAGRPTRVGFAIWNGGNNERAGIKAVSGDWTPLSLDP